MNLYQFKTQSSRALRWTTAYLKVTLHLFGGVAFLWTSTVQANPVGEAVVAGAAGFERVGGALTITQGTDRAVINWNSFSIGAGEITKFVQPNSSSAVLNRVITANNPSAIYGTLQANGQVYLINPAGIFIGPGGLVDTAGFVASTHDVGDKEFMGGGDLNFTGNSGASIVNQGRIEAKQGDVFLVARQVSNEGQIMASDGTVGMISGTEVCLHSIGPNNYKVRLIDVANDAAVQKTGNGIADVVNAGVIEAANAELESTGNYLSLAIKNTGVIRATGVVPNADGSVTLTGGEGDILNTGVVAAIQKNIQGETVGGRILASAKNITTDPGSIMTAAGTEKGGEIRLAAKDTVYASGKVEAGSAAGKGGKVQVTGERVALIQAEVDVSGKSGGGTVLVGGDYLGKNPEVPNAKAVVMTSDSVIRANATGDGDGGKVILWSDEYTGFYGEIFARGGIESGNGGFVETSSKDNLQAFGMVIASAVNGQGGLWLLDPSNVTISVAIDSGGGFSGIDPSVFTPTGNNAIADVRTINGSLNLGTSVTINTDGAGTQNGDITLASAISKTGGTAATLTLNASTQGASGGNIIINSTIIASGGATGALNVELNASQGSITLGNNAITTLGGSVTMRGGLGITQGTGAITTTGGDLSYYGSLNLTGATATIDTGGGYILFNAAVNGLADGAQALTITAGTGDIRFGGDVGSSTTRLGAITISSAGNVDFVKTVTAASLLQSAGTGTTTFSGAQNYNTINGLSVVTDTIVLNSSVTTSSSGTVTLNANNNNVAAESGTLTIDSAGDISADGAVNLTGASGILTAGDVVTTADLISYNSPTTLTGNIKVDTTDSTATIPSPTGADIVFNYTLNGGFTPTLTAGAAGDILFRGVIGGINSLDSLVMTAAGASLFGVTTLNNQTYTTPLNFFDPSPASFVSTSGNITLSNGLDSFSTAQDLTISAANGTVTFGSSLGSLSPFASVTVTAGTSITTQSITTQGGVITLTGPVILSDSSTYDTTGSGAVPTGGNITLTSTLNGTLFDLGLTAGTGGAITGTSVNINNLTLNSGASAAFTGAMTVNDLITTANNYTVSLTGTGNTFAQNVNFLNTGAVTLGNAIADTFLFNGVLNFTGNASVNLAAAISSSGDVINFGAGGVTLLASSTVDTTNAGGTATGAAITFGSTLNGAQTLGLTAGAGNITSTGAVGGTTPLGAVTVNSAANITAVNSGNRFSGLVTIGSSQNTALYLNRFDDANLGPVFANQNFTLFSNGDLTLNPLNDAAGEGKLSNTQLSGFSVGRLILNTGSISIPVAFNYPNIQNLSLITSSGGINGSGVLTVPNLTLQSSGQTSLSGGNKINNIESIVTGAGLELVNSQNLSLNGTVQSVGNNVITVAGQLVNNTGSSTPFAGTTGSTTLRMLSPFAGGSLSLNPAGFSGFTPGYNGVNPGARNSTIYSVSPLTMFAPSGTVIAGVDLSGTQTGGGQLNTFFTGSDDLNWIISDFAKFNLPKVSSAGLEYTIYPKRVESETRSLPDSTLSQLRQELGRPPTIEEINRREVSMRQSDRLRSGSILERSSLDSAEESNEPQENAKATTPSPIEGQVPQANQGPKKVVPTENSSFELAPPMASSQVLPDDSFQPNADDRAAVSELLVKERANAEVGLAIPVARSK